MFKTVIDNQPISSASRSPCSNHVGVRLIRARHDMKSCVYAVCWRQAHGGHVQQHLASCIRGFSGQASLRLSTNTMSTCSPRRAVERTRGVTLLPQGFIAKTS